MKTNNNIFLLSLISLIIVYFGIITIFTQNLSNEVIIKIEKGEGASRIAEKLFENGVIKSKLLFKLIVKIKGVEKSLSSGSYYFHGRTYLGDVVRKLVNADIISVRVLIKEGYNINEVAQTLQYQGIGEYSKYLTLCKNPTYARELTGLSVTSLEGFLYPETYIFPTDMAEEEVLKAMVIEFQKNTKDIALPKNYKYSFNEVLTLASIIEKEAKFIDEKPLIASVYLNRLKIGQRLQADPTVAYALFRKGEHRTVIYYKDLQIDSPYNTYLYNGLPPTPICSPTKSSIEAVLNPQVTDYYYFFAGSDGRHIFSKHYREHMNRQSEAKAQRTKA